MLSRRGRAAGLTALVSGAVLAGLLLAPAAQAADGDPVVPPIVDVTTDPPLVPPVDPPPADTPPAPDPVPAPVVPAEPLPLPTEPLPAPVDPAPVAPVDPAPVDPAPVVPVEPPPIVQSERDVTLRTPDDFVRATLLTVSDEWAGRDFMNQRSELPFS